MSLVAPTFLFRFAVPCRGAAQCVVDGGGPVERGVSHSVLQPAGRSHAVCGRADGVACGRSLGFDHGARQDARRCGVARLGLRTATACNCGSTLATRTTCTGRVDSVTGSRSCRPARGAKLDQPSVSLLAINRARESPRPIETHPPQARCQRFNGWLSSGGGLAGASDHWL
jgi:hypothetical protein